MAVETEPRQGAAERARPGERGRAAAPRQEQTRAPRRTPRAVARLWRGRAARYLVLSPLTRRILLLNAAALGILVIGLGSLGAYQRSLIDSQLDSLATQARIFAGALGESTVSGEGEASLELMPERSRMLLRRLIEPTLARARLFASSGELIADSRYLMAPGGTIQVEALPPPEPESGLGRAFDQAYGWIARAVPQLGELPRYRERQPQQASDYPEVTTALVGLTGKVVYDNGARGLVLSVAVPVQRYKRVVGALMVSENGDEIDAAMRSVRLDILKAFAVALLLTIFFSFYLGNTIVRPIRRLAAAAERLGPGRGRTAGIPDFTSRRDEIGDLSGSLRHMTEMLWQRMDAIERFAADVAHEIKNPLSSLRSAVETAARVKDPDQLRRLMTIIIEDVERLDRLISDISEASRLDAELSRATAERVDLRELLATLLEIYDAAERPDAPTLILETKGERLPVRGLEGRLAQVFRNLIENAVSFSPRGGVIALSARRDRQMIEAAVEDEGPGLPEGKFEAIFERFYTERPAGEKFGVHSGLGLAISKQIVEAHGGTIRAENRHDRAGRVCGARFIVRLPADEGEGPGIDSGRGRRHPARPGS